MKRILRPLFVKHVIFSGDFADVLKQRIEWAAIHAGYVILVDIHYNKIKIGKTKPCKMTLYFVDNNVLMNWLGFRKSELHYKLKLG